MDISLTLIIAVAGFIVTLLGLIVGVVVWLVRLEGKTNMAVTNHEKLEVDVYKHIESKEVHHDGEELNRRFSDFKNDITEVKQQLTGLTALLTTYLLGDRK